MAGFRIVTDFDPDRATKVVRRVAKELSYSLGEVEKSGFSVTSGNMPLSILVGAFVAYCDFRVQVNDIEREKTEVVIDRNSPWWTGLVGVRRVRNAAKGLADAVAKRIEEEGGKVYKNLEF